MRCGTRRHKPGPGWTHPVCPQGVHAVREWFKTMNRSGTFMSGHSGGPPGGHRARRTPAGFRVESRLQTHAIDFPKVARSRHARGLPDTQKGANGG